MSTSRWLLLIHRLPPKPDYLRVKVRRRLQRLGAAALKNAVYALPNGEGAVEDFQWLRREIVADGGEAVLCAASFVDGLTDAEVEALFARDRDAEYAEVAEAAARLANTTDAGELARLLRRFAEIVAIDHFGAPGREPAARALASAEAAVKPVAAHAAGTDERPVGRTWVTRVDVGVDRMASAWLVRRFIDPAARFRFVPPDGYRPAPNELRFDMFDAEYTHEGARCTFETLLDRFALGDDAALVAIGEIVHDIDLKENAFARPETAGVAALVAGLVALVPHDEDRLARGADLLDGLYAALGATRA